MFEEMKEKLKNIYFNDIDEAGKEIGKLMDDSHESNCVSVYDWDEQRDIVTGEVKRLNEDKTSILFDMDKDGNVIDIYGRQADGKGR